MARYTIYKNSFLATFMSLTGSLFVVGGIMGLFSGEILGGIIAALVGFVLAAGASAVSERKKVKTWKKQLETSGLANQIRTDIHAAIQAYNACPGKPALEYIRALNPSAAAYIDRQLAAQQQKK